MDLLDPRVLKYRSHLHTRADILNTRSVGNTPTTYCLVMATLPVTLLAAVLMLPDKQYIREAHKSIGSSLRLAYQRVFGRGDDFSGGTRSARSGLTPRIRSGSQRQPSTSPGEEFAEESYVSGERASEPSVSEPSVSEPSVSEPSVSEPSVSEPSVSEPSLEEPRVAEPSMADDVASAEQTAGRERWEGGQGESGWPPAAVVAGVAGVAGVPEIASMVNAAIPLTAPPYSNADGNGAVVSLQALSPRRTGTPKPGTPKSRRGALPHRNAIPPRRNLGRLRRMPMPSVHEAACRHGDMDTMRPRWRP